jgi:hypothetical protein
MHQALFIVFHIAFSVDIPLTDTSTIGLQHLENSGNTNDFVGLFQEFSNEKYKNLRSPSEENTMDKNTRQIYDLATPLTMLPPFANSVYVDVVAYIDINAMEILTSMNPSKTSEDMLSSSNVKHSLSLMNNTETTSSMHDKSNMKLCCIMRLSICLVAILSCVVVVVIVVHKRAPRTRHAVVIPNAIKDQQTCITVKV